jgi:hypothetical protein
MYQSFSGKGKGVLNIGARNNKNLKKMYKDIESLAKKYWALETKTKRVVRNIQTYAEKLKVFYH